MTLCLCHFSRSDRATDDFPEGSLNRIYLSHITILYSQHLAMFRYRLRIFKTERVRGPNFFRELIIHATCASLSKGPVPVTFDIRELALPYDSRTPLHEPGCSAQSSGDSKRHSQPHSNTRVLYLYHSNHYVAIRAHSSIVATTRACGHPSVRPTEVAPI